MVTSTSGPGVFTGWLRHRRTSPVPHRFTYPLFMVLLDIDRIPELMGRSWCTSYNRWNWASFHEADHFGDPSCSLRERLSRDAASRGVVLPDGKIELLTNLRYLGYCFNPVSFFYCYDTQQTLRLVMAEVNNTFGDTHNYWLEPCQPTERDASADGDSASGSGRPAPERSGRVFRATARKAFYVSPFMPADMRYDFSFTRPGADLVAHMALGRIGVAEPAHGFDATLRLERRPWTSGSIVRALLRYPAMTAVVIAGIHWEALRLWWKGVPLVARPPGSMLHPDNAEPDAGRL